MEHLHWSSKSLDIIVKETLEQSIPESTVHVTSNGNHVSIDIESPAFNGKNLLNRQRLVYSAIDHLLKGDHAPLHAVDHIKTSVPSA
ncbi:MAG: BolA/IbaG family iron-sulfur metabolism protein [SAR324 cluster bacterium]|nr:BolA/IbaG family iron-sulfur metabolism protein [SAR324 cluster bacterium]